MNIQCIKCKGGDLACGRSFCPLITKSNAQFKVNNKLMKDDFYGSSPTPFVGRYGYPNVNVGILSPTEKNEEAWKFDAPRYWAKSGLKIPDIVDFRSSLVNSQFKSYIKAKSDKLTEISKEIGMASRPVDVEINLKQKPKFRMNSDSYMAPTGPNAELKKADITSNPKIHTKVDKVVSDTDMKSVEGMKYLFSHGFDENFLSKCLSIGNFGVGKNRKLVPTRWGITAVDDSLGKEMLKEIRYYPESDYLAYFGNFFGNYFLVLQFPDVWAYELFEMYLPKASWNVTEELQYTTDHEFFKGRSKYAENCAGGYYAARLPILENLKKRKRQATVLCIRIITGEYAVPLGVWVVREAVRKAMQTKPLEFASKELMLTYTKAIIKKKFDFDISPVLNNSLVLKNINTQTKLKMFMSS